jgi:alpha/beta superfamily hydrolase
MSSLQQNWRKGQEGGGKRKGTGERNDPNHVCTYDYMNKEKEKKSH